MAIAAPPSPLPAGLTSVLARERLVATGRNELPSPERRTHVRIALEIIREPMVLLLLVATGLYVALGDPAEAAALGISVLAIISITLWQERRTERALDALRELATPRARTLRDGVWRELDARELVPGDTVHVGEGERIPADLVLRDGTPLQVDESLLTGESVPVVRLAGSTLHAGTLIGSGNATAEVVRTGARTELGRIGATLAEVDLARPPLQREVTHVVRTIALLALALCLALVAIHLAVHHGWVAAVLAGITLAMSLLPEELPLVVTIFVTLGAHRLARQRVLARRAAAIETLGAMTVLCVDKTGTLTINRMAIRRIVAAASYDVAADAAALPEAVHEAVEYGFLACPRQATDATDLAFGRLAERALGTTEHVHPDWARVREYPLRAGLLAVTHAWRADDRRMIVATKGAPEAIIDLCHLDAEAAATWRGRAEAMARDGLRVLGIARAVAAGGEVPDNPHDYAFEIVGLVGLADPLRDETAAAIADCHAAGVRIVMLTGDHPATARAIARAAGLRDVEVLTGSELDALDAAALGERLAQIDVIARAAPEHKLRIVRALQAAGHVVGMTGDGVNDAPALRAADVGIAMGRGTDVAREAAGLVILDDSLASIAAAIRRGRIIYDNLREVAAYLIAVHLPIAVLALVPPILGWLPVLAPIHVVLLELVIDPTCSIVFEREPAAADVMRRPPRGRGEQLFSRGRVLFALALGGTAAIGPIGVLALAHLAALPDAICGTLGFAALIAADLALVAASRDRHARNPTARWLGLAIIMVVAAAIAIPGLRSLFGFAVPDPFRLALAVLAGCAPVLALGLVRKRCAAPA